MGRYVRYPTVDRKERGLCWSWRVADREDLFMAHLAVFSGGDRHPAPTLLFLSVEAVQAGGLPDASLNAEIEPANIRQCDTLRGLMSELALTWAARPPGRWRRHV